METLEKTRSQPALNLNRPRPNYVKGMLHTFFRALADNLNPWNLGFAVGLPIMMYLMFGNGQEYSTTSVGNGNVAATILVSMSLYGAIITSSASGTNISVERAQGWSRQMALTPLPSGWYIAGKILAAISVAAIVVTITFTVGAFTDASMDTPVWFLSGAIVVLGSLSTAALGLAIGYLMKSEAAFGVMGGGVALLAFTSGMFLPVDQMGEFFQSIAPFSPLYGINKIALMPIYGWDSFEWQFVFNAVGWFLLFAILAVIGHKKDTARR